MLLTASPWGSSSLHSPFRSSPLSERSINVPPPRRYVSPLIMSSSSSSSSKPADAKPGAPPPPPFSKRAIKSAPLARSREAVAERRREMFLGKVRQGREEKRWEARNEQITCLDFHSERRRWEEEQARMAPSFEIVEDEEEDEDEWFGLPSRDLPQSSAPQSSGSVQMLTQGELSPEEEAEALLRREQDEVDALVAMMEDDTEENAENYVPSSHFGSDDEDYDALFRSFVPSNTTDSQTGPSEHHGGDEVMDMTNG